MIGWLKCQSPVLKGTLFDRDTVIRQRFLKFSLINLSILICLPRCINIFRVVLVGEKTHLITEFHKTNL